MKARVPDEQVGDLLWALTQQFGPPRLEIKRDIYWSDGRHLVRTREITGEGEGRQEVTAKQHRTEGGLERNVETTLRPSPEDFQTAKVLLQGLGFEPRYPKDKYTLVFTPTADGPLSLLAPEMSHVRTLGWFLEIEYSGSESGAGDDLRAFFAQHGLAGDVEEARYLDLLHGSLPEGDAGN